MSEEHEAVVEVSFPKALLLSALSALSFVVACWVLDRILGMPIRDPRVLVFLTVVCAAITPLFAAFYRRVLRCRVDHQGLCSPVPTRYRVVLRWDDVVSVRKAFLGLFFVVRGRGFNSFCILPGPFLLEQPGSLQRTLERYAPEGNILRGKLAA